MKPFTRGLDFFLSVNQVTCSKISQFLRFAWQLILANIILIWHRNQLNHQSQGNFSFIVKHLVFRLQFIATGYRFFPFCVGFFRSVTSAILPNFSSSQTYLWCSPPNDNIEKGPWKRMICGFDFWRSPSTDIFILLYFVPFSDIWSWTNSSIYSQALNDFQRPPMF